VATDKKESAGRTVGQEVKRFSEHRNTAVRLEVFILSFSEIDLKARARRVSNLI